MENNELLEIQTECRKITSAIKTAEKETSALQKQNLQNTEKLTEIIDSAVTKICSTLSGIKKSLDKQQTPTETASAVQVEAQVSDFGLAQKIREVVSEVAKEDQKLMDKHMRELDAKYDSILQSFTVQLGQAFSAQIQSLTANLEAFTDRIAEKNAEALAEVQRKNNEELQQLSAALASLTKEQQEFVGTCKAQMEQMQKSIRHTEEQYSGFLKQLNEQRERGISGVQKVLQEQLASMIEQLQKTEQTTADYLRTAMDGYKEEFVAANAAALTDAQQALHKKIEALTDSLQKMTEGAEKLRESVEEMREDSEGHKEKINEFIENLEEKMQRMTSDIRDGIQKITNKVKEITEQTAKLEDAVKLSMEQSQKSVQEIRDYQDQMHRLSQQDAELLKGALKQK